jgi:hypothetical protein
MTGMTAAQRRARIRGRVVAWIMVVFFSSAVVILNVYDVVRTGKLDHFLAALVAVIPVIAYVALSEVVAIFRGWILQTLAMASLGLGMMLTTTAVASVVEPVVGPWRCWFYGGVMDLPLAIGLYVIMNKPADGRDLASAQPAAARWLARRFGADAKGRLIVASSPPAAHPAVPAVAHEPAPATPAQVAHEPARATADEPAADRGPVAHPAPVVQSGRTGESARGSAPGIQSLTDRAAEAERARQMYRDSAEAGEPLSKRKLAEAFGRSPNWGEYRINEVKEEMQLASAQ